MGFIKAFSGALSGTFADQWKDYYGPRPGVSATAALFQAVPQGTNAGRGENYKGSENIITNGSKIIVPEGTALITVENGQITGFVAEPGGFEFRSDDPSSRSFFSGDGILSSTIAASWDRVKFGGQPATQQLAFYVNLKEIPGNRFGTQNEIAFFDSFLQTQVSVVTRGTYSIKIVDPLLFVKQFIPVSFLQPNAPAFDFADDENSACDQLFTEVVGCLGGALSRYTSDPEIGGSLIKVQGDQVNFAKSLSAEVEQNYQWRTNRGLEISTVAVAGIEYDEETKKLLLEVRQDDRELRKATRMGQAYGNNMAGMMAAASGQALQNAAANENGAMMGFAGFNMAQNAGGNMLGTVSNMQPTQAAPAPQVAPTSEAPQAAPAPQADPYEEIKKLKELADAGIISEEEFNAKKSQLLGI